MIAGEGGKRYDRFRDRVMFPIHDSRGRVIGFGGRVLGSGEPKYLNSPETAALLQGTRALRPLSCAQRDPRRRPGGRRRRLHGRRGAGAARRRLRGGDARHVDHAGARAEALPPDRLRRVLLRRRRRGPQGGVARAGERAAGAAGRQGRALPVPARRRGPGRLRARARQGGVRGGASQAAMPLSEFLLAELAARHPPDTAEGRAALLAAARPLLAQIEAPILAALLRRRLAALAGLPRGRDRDAARRSGAGRAATSAARPAAPPARPRGRGAVLPVAPRAVAGPRAAPGRSCCSPRSRERSSCRPRPTTSADAAALRRWSASAAPPPGN